MISLINFLNFLSIFLSVVFQILLIRSFGATLQTDSFYLTIGITHFVNMMIVGFATDLFIPVYNDIKKKGEEESQRFTGAIFLFILIIGSLFAIIVFLIAPALVKAFATGFSIKKVSFSTDLLKILSVTIVFGSLNSLMISSLNANLFMLTTYTTALITPTLNNIALIFFAGTYGLYALVISIVLGSLINFLILFFYHFKKVGWRFSNPYGNRDVMYLLKKNFAIRIADIINSLKGPLITNVLSYFPTGYMTLFSYTDKVLNILFRITNSPMLRLLFVKASNLLAKKKMEEITAILTSTLKSNLLLFICALMPTTILFKKMFGLLFSSKLSLTEIDVMYSMFLCLIPLYMTLSLEMPFTNITVAMKKGVQIIKINTVSVILFIVVLLLGIKAFEIYIIPISLSCAQLYNTFVYTKFVNSQLHFFDRDWAVTFILYGILGVLIVLLNFFLRNNFFTQLYSNFFLISLWLLLVGKDLTSIFRMITQRGEIR